MLSFITKRVLQSLVSIAFMVVTVFFLARLTGSPADLYLPVDALESARQEFSALHGFDDPLGTQFLRFLEDLLHGDLGQSLRLNMPATEAVLLALPTTLTLAAIAIPVSLVLSIILGAAAALKPGGIFDRVASALALTAASIPEFWVAIVGIVVLAVSLHWLPSSGFGTPAHWILPVAVLTVRPLGILVQVVRGALVSALGSAYVKTAIAKGAGPARILFVHCVRNAMVPIVTVASDLALNILNGAVIVEIIFGFPGIGRLMLDAVLYRDYALLQALVLTTAILVFAVTALTDILYAIVDPRVENV
ncbi:ABC transporter permease [Ensifer sp. YR511]|uniref:ABC transporter permease n=1 Tax=Ensifer sp. YR511 TaxID=1855294 RepID=UPI000891F8BD|nr:ABC transporter permease [Ensifer sp. YR511]SDN42402.1 peptide/nickel transport system permease protein [Ensifer sp. YR511]